MDSHKPYVEVGSGIRPTSVKLIEDSSTMSRGVGGSDQLAFIPATAWRGWFAFYFTRADARALRILV